MDDFVPPPEATSVHRFNYVRGSPANLVDWSGRYESAASQSTALGVFFQLVGRNTLPMISRAISGVRPWVTVGSKSGSSKLARRLATAVSATIIASCAYQMLDVCSVDLPVFYPGWEHREVTMHIYGAIVSGFGTKFTRREGGHDRWCANQTACEGASVENETDCDEYPFNSTKEDVDLRQNGVSLKVVNRSRNRSLGSRLGQFYDACSVDPTNPDKNAFGVIAIPTTFFTQWNCGSQ